MVSIIIINFNTFNLTCTCIDSVLKHTNDLEYEIILVDNASKECNPDMFVTKYPTIKLIKSKINLGFAGGNNLGIKHSKGDTILLLNSDTELVENSIKMSYSVLSSDPEKGVLSCQLRFPDGGIQWAAQPFPSLFEQLYHFFKISKLRISHSNEQHWSKFKEGQSFYCDWVWGTFFMIKKEVIDLMHMGQLSEAFFMYCEDVEWCFDVSKLNYKVYYYADTFVYHHISASSKMSDNEKFTKYIYPNQLKLLTKMHGRVYSVLFDFFWHKNNKKC